MQVDIIPCRDAGSSNPARCISVRLRNHWNKNTNRQFPGRARPDPAVFSGAWRLNFAALNQHNNPTAFSGAWRLLAALNKHNNVHCREGNPNRGCGRLGSTRGDRNRGLDNSPVSLVTQNGQRDLEADRDELGNGGRSCPNVVAIQVLVARKHGYVDAKRAKVESSCEEENDATRAVAVGQGLLFVAQQDRAAAHGRDGAKAASKPVRRHQEPDAREEGECKRHSGELACVPHLRTRETQGSRGVAGTHDAGVAGIKRYGRHARTLGMHSEATEPIGSGRVRRAKGGASVDLLCR